MKRYKDMTPEEQRAHDISRVRLPRQGEILGVLEQRHGASRCSIRCLDGLTRICRIPGRLKRFLWVREGDIVLVQPWEYEGDKKGDIIFKYKPVQRKILERKGHLDKLNDVEEF